MSSESEPQGNNVIGSSQEFFEGDALTGDGDTVHDAKNIESHAHGSLRSKLESNLDERDALFIDTRTDLDYDGDSTFIGWPWNHKNKTDNSCTIHDNCTACTDSSMTCHWCSFDDECHAKGSWHGCAIGATCPSNDTVDNSCETHKTCTECALSSSLCHWCAFDDECHAIGSMYGCAHGVNCYSNDRCKRSSPEKIEEGIFVNIGFIPLILMFSAAFASLCCISVLFSGANALKGAYDNIADVIVQAPPVEAFSHHDRDHSHDDMHLQIDMHVQLSPIHEDTHADDCQVGDDVNVEDHDHAEASEPVFHECNDSNVDDQNGDNESPLENQHSHSDDIIELHTEHMEEDSVTESLLPVTAHPHPSRLPIRNRPGPGNYHMNCLMRSCKAWLFFSVIGIVFFTSAGVIYFPKAPEYNVCSDQFAWESIIAGLTSLKMEASFEILMSVKNENRLDVALEGFGGKFKHDGEDIGTFSLPRTIVEATSITDLLVTCTVVPDRWEALGLISDYWKGKLEFLVDVTGSVKVKGIGFRFPIKVSDVLVKVNDPSMDDRHLCACQTWKDLVPTASPRLSFEEAVMDPVNVNLALPLPSPQKGVEFAIS